MSVWDKNANCFCVAHVSGIVRHVRTNQKACGERHVTYTPEAGNAHGIRGRPCSCHNGKRKMAAQGLSRISSVCFHGPLGGVTGRFAVSSSFSFYSKRRLIKGWNKARGGGVFRHILVLGTGLPEPREIARALRPPSTDRCVGGRSSEPPCSHRVRALGGVPCDPRAPLRF